MSNVKSNGCPDFGSRTQKLLQNQHEDKVFKNNNNNIKIIIIITIMIIMIIMIIIYKHSTNHLIILLRQKHFWECDQNDEILNLEISRITTEPCNINQLGSN